jgi:antagonist of KipI
MGQVNILRAGPLTTVQDLGRAHHRREGVSLGGALDRHAARVANLLAGNAESAALLEITLGRTRLQFYDERAIAWCGGQFKMQAGGERIPPGRLCRVSAGEELEIAPAGNGGRAWLAIAGGIDVPLVLGSRATDLRAGFGGWEGRALRDGDKLPLGEMSGRLENLPRISSWSAPAEWSRTASSRPLLRVLHGSEWNEFTEASRAAFLAQRFRVSQKCDRMGARLEGAPLSGGRSRERLSEPVAPGTIQVPGDQQPILLLGDCQTIGGYPKIAHVITVDLPLTAQLRPNDSVRFREVGPAEAAALFAERERDLQRFRVGLSLRAR